MYHSPIHIKSLCLSFSHKICFEDFNVTIEYGSRIAIIGRNSNEKSTLIIVKELDRGI
jgi:ATPase subunit of ABC transporter with duplicated ATPase domains